MNTHDRDTEVNIAQAEEDYEYNSDDEIIIDWSFTNVTAL